MKHLKLLLILMFYILPVSLLTGCNESDTHDHDQSGQVHDHTHDESTEDHDTVHVHDEPAQDNDQGHEHAHDDSDLDQEHDHAHGPDDDQEGHTQDATAMADHDTEEGMISSGNDWEKLIGLETAETRLMPLELTISVPGQIVPNQNMVAVVSPFIESSINEVFVNVGDRVEKKDVLVCLTSPEIGMLRAEYDKAKAELTIKKQNYERQQKLFIEKIVPSKSFQEAELEYQLAEVHNNYTVTKLLSLGISNEEIETPPTGHSNVVGSTFHVIAPISGVVTARAASLGQKVDSSSQLFEIIDIESVWLEADIFEKDLTKIRQGQTVKVKVTSYPDEIFTGEIFYIGSTLTPETKTIKVLVEIDNKAEKLKPGMFAETHIVVGQIQNALVIPKSAVLEDENLKVVFAAEENGYHRHVVKTGIESFGFIEIVSGLTPGSTVVTKGNYQLKSQSKMSALDPHAGHSH